jgi:putative membrane protein
MNTQLTPLLAQAGEWHAKNLGEALLYTALFGVVGIVLVFIGFKIFDKAITKIDLEAEISKGNTAAAILSGAAIIAVAIIIAAAMS